MGDGSTGQAGKNRRCPQFPSWEESKVLEWKPRFTAVFVLFALLVVAAIASGYLELIADNWEW
jgi:hypothetical protein